MILKPLSQAPGKGAVPPDGAPFGADRSASRPVEAFFFLPGTWVVVTGLDGAGKTTLVRGLAATCGARPFRLPYHDFVHPSLRRSGGGAPFGDVHTDRLIFAADARLANYRIRDWRRKGRGLVSQRGWMDNFIFGRVQGVGYRQTEALLRSRELERPSAQICLVADPEIAFRRLENAPHRDKYETASFIRAQYAETLRFFERAGGERNRALRAFAGIPSRVLDTTAKSPQEVLRAALDFLGAERDLRAPCPILPGATAPGAPY